MTTVQTRVRQIANKEQFDITAKRRSSGQPLGLRRNGEMGPWTFHRKTRDSHSVSEFKEKFEAAYPSLTCDVLKGDGTIAPGQMKLKALRATY